MRVDELNDETERKMDEMENRTRALAARVETLTAERDRAKAERDDYEADFIAIRDRNAALTTERDTARASSDRWHGVAHRMEEERDAAVKAREEAEVSLNVARKQIQGQIGMLEQERAEAASLRAQVEQLTVERGDYAVKADGLYREIQRLVAQVEQMREALGAFLALFEPDRYEPGRLRMKHGWASDIGAVFRLASAALSPSPASADDCEHDTEPTEGERDALRAQVEQMRGAAEAVWDALNLENRGHPQAILAMRAARERSQTAAFSPSPASGVAGDRCEAGNECGRTGCPECQQ